MFNKARIAATALAVTLLALLALGAGTPLPAAADQPDDVTINVDIAIGSGGGTFTASGAIADSGTVRIGGFATGVPPVPSTGHYQLALTGSAGTIVIKHQVQFSATQDPAVIAAEGRWVIISGSGAYAGLEGQGSSVETLNFATRVASIVFSGGAHVEP